jgi:hypothetical protein
MKIEAKLMEMETRRAMIVEYLNEYKKYNKLEDFLEAIKDVEFNVEKQ